MLTGDDVVQGFIVVPTLGVEEKVPGEILIDL